LGTTVPEHASQCQEGVVALPVLVPIVYVIFAYSSHAVSMVATNKNQGKEEEAEEEGRKKKQEGRRKKKSEKRKN
jgi:hypothetical protein